MSTVFARMSLCFLLTLGTIVGVRGEDNLQARQVFVPISPTASSQPVDTPQVAQLGVQIPINLLNQGTNSKVVNELEQRTEQMQIELASLSSRLEQSESPMVISNVNDEFMAGSVNSVRPGWHFDLDGLAWKLETRNSVYAITTDNSALAVGSGSVQSIDDGWEMGIRGRLARRTSSGWLLGAAYTSFNSSASNSATAPAGGNLWATLSHPNNFEQASIANATSKFDLNLFDLEMLYPTEFSDSVGLEFFGGLRWAKIDQELNALYDGIDFTNGRVNHRSDMTGFGARFGAAFHWMMTDCISIYTKGSGSVLYGRFDRQALETNLGGADTIVDVTEEYGRPVTGIETAVGFAWQYREWLQVRGGYELSNWVGLHDGAFFADSSHEGLYSTPSDDILLHGGFLRFSISR